MWLRLLPLFALSALVLAQGDDTINITMELVEGSAEVHPKQATLKGVTGPGSSIGIEFETIDSFFNMPGTPAATVEVINTVTGFNAGVQHTKLFLEYTTDNMTLDPGSWKVRTKFSIFSPAPYAGAYSLESEEFFVVPDVNIQPNCTSPSSSSGSSAGGVSGTGSTQSNTPASTPSRAGPETSDHPSALATTTATPFQTSNPFQTPSSSQNGASFLRDPKNLVLGGWIGAFSWLILLITVVQL
ncbi:hypothetical protein B0H19DRAFT_1071448 [Mycena capillaripes]|nr:hypothetical protein B0H19DRAFT_1071448 [Mycena capillaripes]